MTIQTIRLRLATLQAAIPNVKKAYSQLPRGILKASELPLFMTFIRDGEYDLDTLGGNDYYNTRMYTMWLLVKPVAEGEEGEGESDTEPWVEIVSNYFLARPSLGNLTGILDARIVSDTGPKKMAWPGTAANPVGTYWGIEFRLKVTEINRRTFEENE